MPIRWPDDHPNAKILLFVQTSRVVLQKTPRTPETEQAAMTLGQIEALIDQMQVGSTKDEIVALVGQVKVLLDSAVGQMRHISSQKKSPAND